MNCICKLVDEVVSQRAEDRIGERVEVLVESIGSSIEGRTDFQGPEVDGTTTVIGAGDAKIGDLIDAVVSWIAEQRMKDRAERK